MGPCFSVEVLYFVFTCLLFFLMTQASKALAPRHLWKGWDTWVEGDFRARRTITSAGRAGQMECCRRAPSKGARSCHTQLGSLGRTCLRHSGARSAHHSHRKPVPHSERPLALCFVRECHVLSFNEEKFHFTHFGGSYTNMPATSHSRDSHGWEDRRGPRSED